MMNIKKLLALALALVMTLSLMACGGEQTAPTETPEQQETAAIHGAVVYNASLCSVLEAFGKADVIVGAYGSLAETYGVPSCGKWNELDVEAVISADPDVIIKLCGSSADPLEAYAEYMAGISGVSAADVRCSC